jgi:hypothetical protein
MKSLLTLLTFAFLTQSSFAQEHGTGLLFEGDTIDQAVEEMGRSLYDKNGNNDLLISQVKRQIHEQLDANPSKSASEVLTKMIKDAQDRNIQQALDTEQAYARLSQCEQLLDEESSKQSFYAQKYLADGADEIQTSLKNKAKQLTAETYAHGSMIGKYTEFVIKNSQCLSKVKELVKKGKENSKCEESLKNSDQEKSIESKWKGSAIQE